MMEEKLRKVRDNFERAARDFGFVFTSPFQLQNGQTAFAHIDRYGSEKGTVILLAFPPAFDAERGIRAQCEAEGFFCSTLNAELLTTKYSHTYFHEMLRDWGRV